MEIIIQNHVAHWNGKDHPCVIGKGGVAHQKTEGDMKTPIGEFPLRSIYYRADRIDRPLTMLPTHIITPKCGWCDDPASPDYNKYITKPFSASHEDLWMEEELYDLFIEVGYNDNPVIKGRGSAIFMHLTPPSGYTAGCIGLDKQDLHELVPQLDRKSCIKILPENL